MYVIVVVVDTKANDDITKAGKRGEKKGRKGEKRGGRNMRGDGRSSLTFGSKSIGLLAGSCLERSCLWHASRGVGVLFCVEYDMYTMRRDFS